MAVTRTTLTVDPIRVAIRVILFFPDRQAPLELINYVPASLKRLIAMRRRYADPNGAIADLEQARTMHAVRMKMWKLLGRFGKNLLALTDR